MSIIYIMCMYIVKKSCLGCRCVVLYCLALFVVSYVHHVHFGCVVNGISAKTAC